MLLGIYAAQRKHGFFLKSDKSIDASKFINYVNVAIKSNATADAADFIDTTRTALFIKRKNETLSKAEWEAFMDNDDVVRYARALVLFKQERFEDVITKLRFRSFEEENQGFRAEILFIKAGYEREEAAHHRKARHTEHGTRQSTTNFKKLIAGSQTATPDLQTKYNLFVKTLLTKLDITDNYRKGYAPENVKNEFKNIIETLPSLLERDWFLEKCALL